MNTYWKHALIRFFLWNEFITLIDCTSAAWVRKVKVLHKQREDYVRCSPDIPCCRTLPPGPVSFFLLSCFFFRAEQYFFFQTPPGHPIEKIIEKIITYFGIGLNFSFLSVPVTQGGAQHLGADPRAHHRLPLCVLNRRGQGRRWPRSSIWWWEKSESKSA